MAIAQVMLFAKDLRAMVAFYGDALDLAIVEEREGWAGLDAGACTLGLHEIPAAYAAGITITRPPERRSDTPYKLTFTVADLEAARARVVALGGVAGEADATRCEVLDPEGNVLVLLRG